MQSRRLACFLLGLWLSGGIFMHWVVWQNYRAVDRLLDHPNPAATLQFRNLGPAGMAPILRYHAEEQNRFYFESWEFAEIAIGSLFFLFLLFGTREDKVSLLLALVLLLATLAERFLLTPEISVRGRMLDFVPKDVYIPGRSQFPMLQNLRWGIEWGKLVIGLGLTARMMWGKRRRSGADVRQELDLINKSNYRHIDR